MNLPLSKPSHVWHFFRAGGIDQVEFVSGDDLRNIDQLDQKLWVALSCPTRGLEFDNRTLDLIDSDKDGRIRVPEMRAAVKWAVAQLKDPGILLKPDPRGLPLAEIQDQSEEGLRLLASARQILSSLGRSGDTHLSVEDTADTLKIFSQTPFNGDGVLVTAAAPDPEVAKVIGEILATIGGKLDRSGQQGVDAAGIDAFYAACQGFATWWQQAQAAGGVLVLGDATPGAYAAYQAVKAKVDDFFTRCHLAAYDGRAAGALNAPEASLVALTTKDLSKIGDDIGSLPLAQVSAGAVLPLGPGVNPAWVARILAFRDQVVRPLLGETKDALSDVQWQAIGERLAPYNAWIGSKQGGAVESLGIARIQEILAGSSRAALGELLAKDLALAPQMAAIDGVDRLVRFHRDLYRLLRNYINFADFYSRERLAIYQAGTLYFDGRSCNLCLKVEDMAKHALLAPLSKTYLVYCDCTRKDMAAKVTIAAAFTAGDADFIMAGRNGVFYDRLGRDWDAVVVKVVENPISIRQAIWAPYKRMAKLIGDQIEKLAAARDKEAQDKMAAGIDDVGKSVDKGKAPAPAPGGISNMVGILAAVGLAVGAIGTALATGLSAFLGLQWWQMPLALLGIMMMISGPSVIIAWLKLRQRTLGPLLDASGWAINGRVKINLPLGRVLTQIAVLPPGAERSLVDLYPEDKKAMRIFWVCVGGAMALILILQFVFHLNLFERLFGLFVK